MSQDTENFFNADQVVSGKENWSGAPTQSDADLPEKLVELLDALPQGSAAPPKKLVPLVEPSRLGLDAPKKLAPNFDVGLGGPVPDAPPPSYSDVVRRPVRAQWVPDVVVLGLCL